MSEARIAAIRLLCPEPARTADFYRSAFGCDVRPEGNLIVLAFGQGRVELAPGGVARAGPAPGNATAFQHFALIVSDMGAAYTQLQAVPGWTAISRNGPERLPASSGGVTAFKFRDPDGHPLELLAFPADRTPPAWQQRAGLFLGVDHTAISVADTEQSIAFYGQLGFRVASRGVNRGPEQARLDGLDAPTVEVTALEPPGGHPPHLELLCYREPVAITEQVGDDDALASRMVLLDGPEGAARETQLSDPDGHRVIVLQR